MLRRDIPVREIRRTPASDSQTLFWLQQLRSPERCGANLTFLVRLDGRVDTDRFCAAIDSVMRRHEIFRTSFDWGNDGLEQVVHTDVEPPVAILQIPGEQLSGDLITQLNMHQFAHDDVPLFRVTVTESASAIQHVHMLVHHSIFDLHTQKLFVSDLSRAYRGEPLGRASTQYAEFAAAEYAWKDSEAATRQRHFWQAYVEDFPAVPAIACDEIVPPGSVHVDLGEHLSSQLREFCTVSRTPVFLVLAAAYQMALSTCFGVNDFGVGIPFTNRRRLDTAQVAGCAMNILPLRATPAPGDSLLTVIAAFRRQMLTGHRYQELSILEIINLAGRTLYQFGFTMDAPLNLQLEGCESQPLDCPRPGPLPLFYHAQEDANGNSVRIRADYSGEHFGPDRTRRFNERFLALLSAALLNPECDLSALGTPRRAGTEMDSSSHSSEFAL